MTDFALHLAAPASHTLWRPTAMNRVLGSARYGVVLLVWGLLFVVRPGEAMDIYRARRWNSPLRRRTQR